MAPNLYSLNLETKEITKLTNFEQSQVTDRGFSVSPDEKSITYVDGEGARRDIWTAGLRGENPVQVTNDSYDDSGPIWHPDGKRIIYNSDRNGTKQICIVDLNGRQPKQLTTTETDSFVADISRDGTKIVFISSKDDADLWGVSVDSGKESQITSNIGVEFWPDISPSGGQVAYQAIRRSSTGGKLLNCLLLTQNLDRDARLSQVAADGFDPLWSPDGGRIAYLRSEGGTNTLWVSSINAADATRVSEPGVMFGGYSLLPSNRLQTSDFQWSPDGASLIYSARRDGVSNIWQASLDGSGERQLSNNTSKALLFFNPMFSHDGKTIAWSAMTTRPEDPAWSVWLLSEGTITQVLANGFVTGLIGWTPDQRLILKTVQSQRGSSALPVDVEIVQLDTASDRQSQLTSLKAAYLPSIVMTRDGKTLGYVTRLQEGDSLRTLMLSNNSSKALVESDDNRVYFSNPVFAPDGKTLYYSKQANWQVISSINDFR
jgi:TolB protein